MRLTNRRNASNIALGYQIEHAPRNPMKRLPTLIPYRSAEAMRDDAIRFAYRKMGLRLGVPVAILCLLAAMRLLTTGSDELLVYALLGGGAFALAVVGYCGKTMEFPHCPRLSLEELELMRNEMGLRPDIYRQTHDSVLHGTFDEHRAIEQTNDVLAKIKCLVKPEQQ